MASIIKQKNGRKAIQFRNRDGKRPTLTLGKATLAEARIINAKVEALVSQANFGTPLPAEVSLWLEGIGDTLRNKLVKVGLLAQTESAILGAFLDSYLNRRSDVKSSTALIYNHVVNNLKTYFGEDKLLRDISPANSLDFQRWLKGSPNLRSGVNGLSDSTVKRRCGITRQFFNDAVDRKLIPSNPFNHKQIKVTASSNTSRQYFVTEEESASVMAACPDHEWRLIFALARWGGLRCPSEILPLTWDCVDWEQYKLKVFSPKTEHYPGMESRIIPLFPQLVEPLQTAIELADKRSPHIITMYRNHKNYSVPMSRIIKKAGLKPWPKVLQNLRSTRQTELTEQFPIQCVCDWIGNSQAVAKEHYLQIREQHFEEATGKALQKPMQHTAINDRIGLQTETPQNYKCIDLLELANSSIYMQLQKYARQDSNLQPSGSKPDALSN